MTDLTETEQPPETRRSRGGSRQTASFMNWLSMGLSILAVALAGVAAWGTWEQVRVDRESSTESLTLVNYEVKIGDGEHERQLVSLFDANDVDEYGEEAQYLLSIEIANVGRADGVVSGIELTRDGRPAVGFVVMDCRTEPRGDLIEDCSLPLPIVSGGRLFLQRVVDSQTLRDFICLSTDEVEELVVTSASGEKLLIDDRTKAATQLTCGN